MYYTTLNITDHVAVSQGYSAMLWQQQAQGATFRLLSVYKKLF